jgi:hypothetical protein
MLLRSRLLAAEPWDATSLDQLILDKFARAEGFPSVESAEE